MSPIFLAVISGIILSLDTVLIKVFTNRFNIYKLSSLLNYKILIYMFLIILIGIFGFVLWIFALQKTDLTKIYWITSIYYLLVPIFSIFILKEKVSGTQFLGYAIITIGASFASSK